ncbi:MAG TPA: acyl-ACP--UDP-N-acetylglucosamine O-acyltransferase [Coxiellaceae bacterium]|nr:acyl-ACP--UDP-N-acetylglucosamine O-acyltransferase [Coxiellaceae bacterium]
MQTLIDSSAKIHSSVKIANNVTVGSFAFIGEHVEIGEGSKIDAHAVITKNTILGKNNHIYSHAVIGGDPQDLMYRGEETWLKMGDDNIVREFATINRGSHKEDLVTIVGNSNCFLSYSHVAHDARVGNHTLFINNASIGGHVTVHDFAIIGASVMVHQFACIGAYSFLVHAAQVTHDIPPFMLAKGSPAVPVGLNLVGLRRHSFSQETIRGLKTAYRLLYRDGLSLEEAKTALTELVKVTPKVQMIIDLMQNSKRGVLRKHAQPVGHPL